MSNDSATGGGRYREFAVLALVPGIVGALIVASWALAHWKVGPLFVNAGNFDFRLRPDSPALKMGFQQIDMSTVGPRVAAGQ